MTGGRYAPGAAWKPLPFFLTTPLEPAIVDLSDIADFACKDVLYLHRCSSRRLTWWACIRRGGGRSSSSPRELGAQSMWERPTGPAAAGDARQPGEKFDERFPQLLTFPSNINLRHFPSISAMLCKSIKRLFNLFASGQVSYPVSGLTGSR